MAVYPSCSQKEQIKYNLFAKSTRSGTMPRLTAPIWRKKGLEKIVEASKEVSICTCMQCTLTSVTTSASDELEAAEAVTGIEEKMDFLISEVKDIKQSMDFNKKFEEFKHQMKNSNEEVAGVKKMVQEVAANQDAMKPRISGLEKNNEEYLIYSTKKNLEIRVLKELPSENLLDMFIEFCRQVGVELKKEDVDNLHRVNTFNKSSYRPLIVKFCRNLTKQSVLQVVIEKVKSKHKITGKMFGVDDEGLVVVNHHMPPSKKLMMKKARELGLAKVGVYEDGAIYCQLDKTKKETRIFIRSEEDFEKIKAKMNEV